MTQALGSPNSSSQQMPTDRTLVVRPLLLLSLFWVLLTQGAVQSWVVGILVVPLAIWAAVSLQRSVAVQQNPAISLTGLVSFLPFFFWQSLCGGWLTAMFAVHPGRRLRPGFIRYCTRLPEGRPRIYFLHIISLLPGTVSTSVDSDGIVIHVLDLDANHQQALTDCELKVASLFAISLAAVDSITSSDTSGATARESA